MKRRVIKIGVLVILFAAALVISSLVVNRGTEDEIIDMIFTEGHKTLMSKGFRLTLDGSPEEVLTRAASDTEVLRPQSRGRGKSNKTDDRKPDRCTYIFIRLPRPVPVITLLLSSITEA